MQQVLSGPLGGGKMQVGGGGRQAAVDLLREGMPLVMGAQARLHVSKLDAAIERQQGGGDHGGRVADGQHPIRLVFRQDGIQMGKDGSADLGERLVLAHQVEVIVGYDLE